MQAIIETRIKLLTLVNMCLCAIVILRQKIAVSPQPNIRWTCDCKLEFVCDPGEKKPPYLLSSIMVAQRKHLFPNREIDIFKYFY